MVSGNRERILKDFPRCNCRDFKYWTGRNERREPLVCFNPDTYGTEKVFTSAAQTKRYWLEKVFYIVCSNCNQYVNVETYRDIMQLAYYLIDRG